MSDLAERYILLALRLDRHDEGLVETYYGPPELRTHVDAEDPVPPAELVAEADRLLEELPEGWLRDQVGGVRARAGMVAGETWTYADEVAACFGTQPTRTTEEQLEAAYADLEGLLPGPGSLAERYRAWERATQVSPDGAPAFVDRVVEASRDHARRLFGLEQDAGFTVEYVRGESWMAFHEYLGDLRATVSVNVDLPRSAVELLHTVLHETYAGHHVESCLKETGLVRDRGLLESSIVVVPTPQSLVSEGLAEVGPSLLLDGPERATYADLVRDAGVDTDFARDRAVAAAVEPVQRIGADAGRLLYEEGWSTSDVLDYLDRWALVDRAIVENVVRFVAEPMNRGYINCYPQGRARCGDYLGDDPEVRLARFRVLVTQQVRVGDLMAPAL